MSLIYAEWMELFRVGAKHPYVPDHVLGGDSLVVIFVAGQSSEKQRVCRRLHGLALVIAIFTGTPGAATALDRLAPGMTFPSLHVEADRAFENWLFDPAAAEFNSLLSYGAMSLIAPTIFGDFQSPTAASLPSISGSSGFMPANSGLDPVAATQSIPSFSRI